MIYLTAIGLRPGNSSTVHIYAKQYIEQHNQYIEQHNSVIRKSADRAPSLRVIPWQLPYKWGKSTEKPCNAVVPPVDEPGEVRNM